MPAKGRSRRSTIGRLISPVVTRRRGDGHERDSDLRQVRRAAGRHHRPDPGIAQGLRLARRPPGPPHSVPRDCALRPERGASARLRPVRPVHRSRARDRPEPGPETGARGLDRRTRLPDRRGSGDQAGGQRQRRRRPARAALSGDPHAARRRRRSARHPVRIRPGRDRHGRDDLCRPPGEPRAGGGGRGGGRADRRWRELWGRDPRIRHAGIRAQRGRARPRHRPGQHQPRRARADGDRPQFPGQGQRQHRQFGGELRRRRGGRENGVGDPLGRRHGDGPLDGTQHPQHPLLDRAQLSRADRHGADLPGAGEGRRRPAQARLGGVQGHADRAGRAGGGLFHHPRRRAPRLRAADGQARHRHRVARRLDHGALVPRRPPRELPLRAVRRHLRHHAQVRRVVLARRRAADPAPTPTPTTGRNSPSSRRWAS